ncbi:MAG: ACP phosphodiesterase [Gammaproteobacteria bacterium]|nr:ACP phosphodiesterase [Gammaproteobacteria bacterium]
MNFLAHCLLPDRAVLNTHPDLIAGGFIGDFIKGPVPDSLPAVLADGVRLHRRIDAYSNLHPGIRRSCERFSAELRRFAPIFVDVVADHLLARHWLRFHPLALETFTAGTYAAIRPHVDHLPADGQRFFDYMSEHDLLAGYRRPEAMERALCSITRRLSRPVSDARMLADVQAHLPELEADFLEYFPDLISHAAAWLELNAGR